LRLGYGAADILSETDIWRAAMAMVKRYGVVAILEAAARADQLLEDGEPGRRGTLAPDPERNRAAAG
jgi:hypothetical protein